MKLFLVIVVIGCALAGCSSPSTATAEGPPAAVPSAQVTVDAQTQEQLKLEIQPALARIVATPIAATGQLQLNEDTTWRVGAVTGGRIANIRVHLGETVKAGQLLAQMHSHEVHDSRADHRQAAAELDRVKLLASQALRVRDRTNRLFDLRAASREQVEAAETQYQSAQLTVANAQAGLDRADAHLTEILEVPLTEAPASESDNDWVPIKAPAPGTVMERLVTVGSVVSIGDPVVVVSDLSSLWLIAAVNEADLSRVRRGQAVKVSVRAYPDRMFKGKVFQLGERLDVQTRTLQVRVLVSNAQGLLKPDMFATTEFSPQAQEAFVHVPESAVQDLRGKAVVFAPGKDGEFRAIEVETGERTEGQVRILSGLPVGTPVVTRGSLLLKSHFLKSAAN